MTSKPKKAKHKKARPRRGTISGLWASVEDEILFPAQEEDASAESRWNRPRKRRISLRLDVEVVDWLQSHGPGYQTRINVILRRLMLEGKKRTKER